MLLNMLSFIALQNYRYRLVWNIELFGLKNTAVGHKFVAIIANIYPWRSEYNFMILCKEIQKKLHETLERFPS